MEQILEYLVSLDEQVFLFFNGGLQSGFMDRFMMLFTGKFIWIPMYAAILFVIFREYKWKAAGLITLALVMSIVLSDQICATAIRPYVERLRPSNLENELSALTYVVDGYRGGRYGFPSCHAANSFALAAFMCVVLSSARFKRFVLIWALFNSYTRLYLGVHYPGDLLVGGIIGALIGVLLALAVRRAIKRMDEVYSGESGWHFPVGGGRKIVLRNSDAAVVVGCVTICCIVGVSALS